MQCNLQVIRRKSIQKLANQKTIWHWHTSSENISSGLERVNILPCGCAHIKPSRPAGHCAHTALIRDKKSVRFSYYTLGKYKSKPINAEEIVT